eukprot:gnl/MRDRNA2_/MRDRNA2_27270_c0_seq1.p1 gnl/MRDRNA2_/MRDRNA2_27270_c0~~gnl/MRDRNA2_/MRDRNA2_27270_c0_seq1.p1  ORF type:complete len:518 (+),score=121.39 gnl/MRDRNA2_/MRDRNA2_27270_c0_seq1:137-1690(+)
MEQKILVQPPNRETQYTAAQLLAAQPKPDNARLQQRRADVCDFSESEFRRSSLYRQRAEALQEATGLEEEEFQEATAMFEEMDSTNNGTLDMNEIDLLFRRLKLWLSVPQLWALVQEVDTDCNGQIELDEFAMMLAKIRGRRPLSLKYYTRQLPRKTREQFEGIFRIIDTDKDGSLSKSEMRAGLQRLNVKVQLTKNDAEFDKYFKEIDADGSGKIDVEEFICLMAKLRKPVPQLDATMLHLTNEEKERFRIIFDTFDVGGGGTLNAHELHNLFEKLGYSFPSTHTQKMVHEVDLDGSGTVDFDEFLFLLVRLGCGSATEQRVILRPGATYEEAHSYQVPLSQLWDLGYDDISRLREAGWSPQELYEAEMASLLDLRRSGFTASELRRAGWNARDLKLAGYSMSDLRVAGFSAATLRRCSREMLGQKIMEEPGGGRDENGQRALPLVTVARQSDDDLQDGTVGPEGGLFQVNAGTIGMERPHTADSSDLRWWSTPRIRSLCDGPKHDWAVQRPVTAA